jgi:soluble lytic murein transglycosylase
LRGIILFKLYRAIIAIIGLSLLGQNVSAQNYLIQEAELRNAFAQAKNGTLQESALQGLSKNPLLPWLKAINLKQQIENTSSEQVVAIVGKQAQDPAYDWLIIQWRNELIRREDWQGIASWQAKYPSDALSNRCALLLASNEANRNDKWQKDVLNIWQSESKLNKPCILAVDALNTITPLTAAQKWQRFDYLLANDSKEFAELRERFTGTDLALLNQYIAFMSSAKAPAEPWPSNERTRAVLTNGLLAQAKRETTLAETLLTQYAKEYALNVEQKTAVQSEIVLWSMVNYQDNADARYFAVPEKQRSANLREWYMRYLFAQNDDNKILAGFEQLLPEQRNEDRWQYFQARILERLNRKNEAMAIYRKVSQAASYHGWLAADRSQSDYALCPLEPTLDKASNTALKNNMSLKRAFMLWQLNEANYAIWEWNAAYKALSDSQKPTAIEMAQKIAWYDRAVFSFESTPVNQRYYSLRFALPYQQAFQNAATRFQLNPSWLMAHARAESIFMPDVVSSANARGLLQLIPSTAEAIASKNAITWLGPDSLYNPDTNIVLGAGALRNEINSYPNKAYQAIGAYNAGPTPVNRWQSQRPNLDPDFWIETVTYKETREYIARVLAFSVIYDWRLKKPIVPISNRMVDDFSIAGKNKFSCPITKTK